MYEYPQHNPAVRHSGSQTGPQAAAILLLMLLVLLPLRQATANTVVQVNTSLGEFSIELFDELTPITVANFLNYVTSGRYDGTAIHRSEPDFVIQGGWLTFDEQAFTFFTIDSDQPIVNEFNVSNTRGTIAMAKQAGDPDSASSQWFINLTDNLFLDSDNGGFTVFGQVLDNGMDVVDAIAALPRALLVANSPFPVINFIGGSLTNSNLVTVEMSVVDSLADAPNVFDAASGLLNVTLDAGTLGLAALSFQFNSTAPEVVIQPVLSSVQALTVTIDKIATFDATDGRLTIPELVVAGEVAFRNVVFRLSDAAQLLFTLESVE